MKHRTETSLIHEAIAVKRLFPFNKSSVIQLRRKNRFNILYN